MSEQSSNQVERFIAELSRELVMANFPLGIRNMDENEAACRQNEKLLAVLERRLKPLLEAGQAMWERLNVLSDEVGASEPVSGMAWDAAISEREDPHGTGE